MAFVRDANANTVRFPLGWRQPFDADFSEVPQEIRLRSSGAYANFSGSSDCLMIQP